jgi:lysophospholipase L1-like esterase
LFAGVAALRTRPPIARPPVLCSLACAILLAQFCVPSPAAEPLPQDWDYTAAMRKVAAEFTGKSGVVIHVGDSITYANPYGQWAMQGQGMTEEDKALLKWMHAGSNDDTDGWYLASFDHPIGGQSYTAAGGIRLDEMLASVPGRMISLTKLVRTYKPQIVVLMLGSNDATYGRAVVDYRRDMETAIETIMAAHAIPIVSTIPPHFHERELAESYNAAIREIARHREIPMIDYEREILTRRPNDWNGTLLGKDDEHPTAATGGENGVTASSAPTDENLRRSGYLLRGWLSVKKIGEVKRRVLDRNPNAPVQR